MISQRQPVIEICEVQYLNLIGISETDSRASLQWRDAKKELIDRAKRSNTVGDVAEHRTHSSRKQALKKAAGTASPKFAHATAWIQDQIKNCDDHTEAGEMICTLF